LKLLLDSHPVFWALYEPENLSAQTAEAISDEGNELYISLATVWELSNKAGAGRLPIGSSTVDKMVERISQLADTIIPITRQDVVAAAILPRHHADPFDRMLIAQAQRLSLHLVTKDQEILLYDVMTLWQ